jgi:hypothetical protein
MRMALSGRDASSSRQRWPSAGEAGSIGIASRPS